MPTSTPNINILLFWFHDDWGTYGRAYERIAEYLSQHPEINHVTCMFPPISDQSDKYLKVRQVSKKLTLLTETKFQRFRLDRPLSRLRKLLNEYLKTKALRTYLRDLGYRKQNTVLWLFPPHPYIERLLKVVPYRLSVAHVIDNFTKLGPSHALYPYAQSQYPRLGELADIIITTSQANQHEFSNTGRPCYLFYPAVDKSFIGNPGQLPFRKNGTAPHLGYVGWIMERTDLDLLSLIARQRPDWKLTLVGPQYPENILKESELLSLPNVDYLGSLPQEKVPDFLQTLDVCLMPHRDNEYSRSMGPLKLYQYLASGKPVVTTNVAGLDKVREHLYIASEYAEYIKCISDALDSDSPELAAKRIEAASRETWDIRVREMFNVVLTHFH